MQRHLTFCIILALSVIFISTGMSQDVPNMINYQGFLTDKDGKALNDSYQLTFSIYDKASGDDPWLWQETHNAVKVEAGIFNVLLGSIDTLTVDDLSGDRFLGITLAGELEMVPRLRLASVPFSLRADEANNAGTLDNIDSDEFVAVAGDTMTGNLTIDGGDINVHGKVKENDDELIPRGVIVMWSGTLDSIPAGWAICNGDSGTPNLTDKFIYGVGTNEDPGGEGGQLTHLHSTNIPSFTSGSVTGTAGYVAISSGGNRTVTHSHSVNPPATNSNSVSHLPPYFKLAFIMKL